MICCDAHCHLGSRQFDEDRDRMIEEMLKDDVRKAIIICCSEHDLKHGLELREKHSSFKLAMAIHPQDLEDDHSEKRLLDFEEKVKEVRPDMIGEIGLDYYSHPHTKDRQIEFFKRQLDIAETYHLPVDIHCRKAANDTYEILKKSSATGIIHSYSGSIEMARQYMKLGYYISFGASVLFKGARKPKEVIEQMPLERLLIETDAPYQSPVIGQRHEPKDVKRIYEAIASIKGMELSELCEIVEHNFAEVFKG